MVIKTLTVSEEADLHPQRRAQTPLGFLGDLFVMTPPDHCLIPKEMIFSDLSAVVLVLKLLVIKPLMLLTSVHLDVGL